MMGVWTAMGGTNMVLYLAGLQGIDPTLYEAAEIDGADAWSTFWHVTWPELRPTTFFILTTNLIGGFQIFDQVYIMTGGGPEGATTTILYYIYANMYVFEGRLGYAAAISLYLFAIVFLVTLVNYFGSRGGARAVRS
jgi:multiple sugar transport system permease protein